MLHEQKLAKNAPIVGPYVADLDYTLAVDGTATSIPDKSVSNASLMIDLSVWKSTKGLVAMDIIDGMLEIEDYDTYNINSGAARYLIKSHKIIVIASTDSGLLKLLATAPKDVDLPAEASDSSLTLNVLSPQSKLVAKWFLNLQGEIDLSSATPITTTTSTTTTSTTTTSTTSSTSTTDTTSTSTTDTTTTT